MPDPAFRADVLAGLASRPRSLPCKYFYDKRGSELFDEICELDEYYLTRTETALMGDRIDEMAAAIGPGVRVVEPGSGSSQKTRILLAGLHEVDSYIPVDISEEHLHESADALRLEFPDLEILPVVADFTQPFQLPVSASGESRDLIYFPGSTIGNFTEQEVPGLLSHLAAVCGGHGGMLVGFDLKKDPAIIEAAYNDASGVTARFNLNLLRRIDDELGGTFGAGGFRHRAVYEADRGRVAMSLVSGRHQQIRVAGRQFEFAEGEEIHTEYCYKYGLDQFSALAERAGFRFARSWTDARRYFGIQLFSVS